MYWFQKPFFGQNSKPAGSSGRPKNGRFGFRLEPFWGLGRPWAIWRPEAMCFYMFCCPWEPETICFYVFLAPGSPKPRVFTCFWPQGARNNVFLYVFGPWGPETTCFYVFWAPGTHKHRQRRPKKHVNYEPFGLPRPSQCQKKTFQRSIFKRKPKKRVDDEPFGASKAEPVPK